MAVRLHRDEQGAALVMVMFLGLALVAVATALTVRAARQVMNVALEADHEQALQVAETGLNQGLMLLQDSGAFTTGEVAPTFANRSAERDWIEAVAEQASPSRLVAAPHGEYVVIKPVNADVVYAVGYAPNRAADSRRIRVLRAELGFRSIPGSYFATYALLSGRDLGLNGNPAVFSGRVVGVHANGFLDVSGSTSISACLSASGGARISGAVSQPAGCAAPGNQVAIEVPMISPRALWVRSQYDMCPDGRVRAGPAHPTLGRTAANRPCTGSIIGDASTTLLGWKFTGCCDAKMGAKWDYDTDFPTDGVFYFFEGSVKIPKSAGTGLDPWHVTLIVEPSGTCPSAVGGDVDISGNPTMVAHAGGGNLVVAAGRDLRISGSPQATGVFGAHEQIVVSGNPELTESSLLAEDACDSTTSNEHSSFVSGNPTITNAGEVATPFYGTRNVEVMVGWDEL